MKKILIIALSILSLSAFGQVNLPDGIHVLNPKPADDRTHYSTRVLAWAGVPSSRRYAGLTVFIDSANAEYWWKYGDLTNSGLIIKTIGSGTGTVNSGTSGQIAYYAGTGTAVSGTNALPSATTATTQSAGDNSTKVATTAYVDTSPGSSNITTLGTITTGTWHGSGIGATYGGTGQSSVAQGDMLIGSATPNTWSKVSIGSSGKVWTSNGTTASWQTPAGGSSNAMNGFTFAPHDDMDATFIVWGAGIAVTNSPTVGDPIQWSFLETADHHTILFDSIYANTSKILEVHYPNMRNVINFTAVPDETFAGAQVSMGGSVQLTAGLISAYQPGNLGIRCTYSGSGSTWNVSGLNPSLYSFSFGPYYGYFNVSSSVISLDYDAMSITYVGLHNRHIQRLYSGLGSYNALFVVRDSVSGVPTLDTKDEVVISGGGIVSNQLNLYRWNTTNQFMSGFGDIWIQGAFEAWMVAAPLSTTSVRVRYQTRYKDAMHVAASTYKIYRDTHKSFCCSSLIYTGTAGTFDDTGLTADTQYYYKLVATVSGSDVDVTTFKTRTLK